MENLQVKENVIILLQQWKAVRFFIVRLAVGYLEQIHGILGPENVKK